MKMLEPPFTLKVAPLLLDASGSGVITDVEIGICVSDVLRACSLVVDADNKEGLCSIEPEVCGLIGTLTNVAPLLDADKVELSVDVRLETIVTSCGIKVELEPTERVSTVEKGTSPVSAVEIDVLVEGRLEITVTSVELELAERLSTLEEETFPMYTVEVDLLVDVLLETCVASWDGKIEFAGWGTTMVMKLKVPDIGNVGAAAIVVPFRMVMILMMLSPWYGDWAPSVTPACVVMVEDEEAPPLPITTKHSIKMTCHILATAPEG
ncbi:hypothetical protein LTR17_007049 [Elasticomyces elasticus]|nr:hypothetical protein LTR17_007049 [Elasticomyces elasticus]